MPRSVIAFCLGSAIGQQAGDNPDFHLPLPILHCSKSDGCQKEDTSATLDANWRWLHNAGGYDNCYGADGWNDRYCPDGETCSKNCALEGIDEAAWRNSYGVTTVENGLKLKYIPGSRIYLLDSRSTYKMFSLKNKEFSVDIDVSNVPCGVNGALYFSEMERDGGMKSSNGLNKAGAEYGSGYCDAQCPTDIHFIGGHANVDETYGSCCAEFDIWEANMKATAYTAHPCNLEGPERVQCRATSSRRRGDGGRGGSGCCSWAGPDEAQVCGKTTEYCKANADNCKTCGGHWVPGAIEALKDELEDSALPPCSGGMCDQPGCDFNPYRTGIRDFYGPDSKFQLDTTKPFTVLTQFLTHDGRDDGDLVEVRRSYVQNGKTIQNPAASFPGLSSYDSLKDDTCAEQKRFFNRSGTNEFGNNGGLMQMGDALERGMVLALSIWDDHADQMQWLDGYEPEDPDEPYGPGAIRGPCPHDSGDPKATRKANPNAYVIYSNIRYGEIDSTHPRGRGPGRRRAHPGIRRRRRRRTSEPSFTEVAV